MLPRRWLLAALIRSTLETACPSSSTASVSTESANCLLLLFSVMLLTKVSSEGGGPRGRGSAFGDVGGSRGRRNSGEACPQASYSARATRRVASATGAGGFADVVDDATARQCASIDPGPHDPSS